MEGKVFTKTIYVYHRVDYGTARLRATIDYAQPQKKEKTGLN